MSELKPCPFCGGEEINIRAVSFANGSVQMWIECASCPAHTERTNDFDIAIEAWNTRSDDYKQAAEYWQRMYEQAFAERTCEEFGSLRIWQECYVWSHDLSCGHEVDTFDMEPPNYCPECGAKVVG